MRLLSFGERGQSRQIELVETLMRGHKQSPSMHTVLRGSYLQRYKVTTTKVTTVTVHCFQWEVVDTNSQHEEYPYFFPTGEGRYHIQ